MCEACGNSNHKTQETLPRRKFLKESGTSVLAAGAIMGTSERVIAEDVRYRFVVNFASGKSA
ncbi:twin-arginine translocation signal domain-containing protein [Bartonella choladocola]|uniref:Tat (Twin-arginine translocation) pathway signal sequence n=1 Tax=Bartonella choladocola TaxID=2750995 RepID=A0A1U9MFQ1_9HYPH|nr:twin-arginine translocation signal domain-containing protein [Bartonella choladocola]AQT46563.1 Tat (twin-arginine translocation) pathway signal sequence [Bartonella choladocola]